MSQPASLSSPEVLLEAIGRGSELALKRLYDLESRRLYGIALRIVRRPETAADVLAGYKSLLARLSFAVIMDPPMLVDEALETAADTAVAQTASEVLRDMGLASELAGVPYGSDASKLSRHGVPSIIFGPGSIDRAHAAVEYVECDQVLRAEEFYRQFLLRFQ